MNKEQQELDAIHRFLKNTTEEYSDYDWDGKELKVFLDDEVIEKYSRDDLQKMKII